MKIKQPLVSVIMSVYNCEKYIEDALNSIINQTYKNKEILLVDDNSNDNTVKIIEKIIKGKNNIFFIKNSENLGLTKNLNTLIKMANGEYICRMDADDISINTRIEKQVNFLQKNLDVSIIGSFGQYIDEENNIEEKKYMPIDDVEIKNMIYKVNPMIHSSIMFRKDKIISIGMYDEIFKNVQDYELWFKAMANGLKFYNIPEFLILLRRDKKYSKRKSKKYRLIDLKVRIKGYRLNNFSIFKYIYLSIPLALIILPSKFIDKYFYMLKKIDPREKGRISHGRKNK